eukprot:4832373-Prymnesium_polylepis.1
MPCAGKAPPRPRQARACKQYRIKPRLAMSNQQELTPTVYEYYLRPVEYYQLAISRPSAGHRQVIGRPSAGNRQVIGRPSAGHQQAIGR